MTVFVQLFMKMQTNICTHHKSMSRWRVVSAENKIPINFFFFFKILIQTLKPLHLSDTDTDTSLNNFLLKKTRYDTLSWFKFSNSSFHWNHYHIYFGLSVSQHSSQHGNMQRSILLWLLFEIFFFARTELNNKHHHGHWWLSVGLFICHVQGLGLQEPLGSQAWIKNEMIVS